MRFIVFLIVIVYSNINTYSYENIKWRKVDLPELAPNDPFRNFGITIDNTVLLDVFFLESNPDYGWVSGFNSITLRTTDGGESWDYSIVTRNGLYQLESIFFVSENVGYASGPCNNCSSEMGGVFKSIDGGISWKEITPQFRHGSLISQYSTLPLWGLYFVDENEGYVVGGDCGSVFTSGSQGEFSQAFYKTTNGGDTWSLSSANIASTKLADLIVDENNQGWAISSGYLWNSNGDRSSWSTFSVTGNFDWHEDISKYNNSFIVPYSVTCDGSNSDPGGIRVTTNLGNSWIEFNTGFAMYGSLMTDDSTGWGVGYGASVYQTTSGGIDWKNINTCLEGGDFIDDIALDSRGTYWLVGDDIWRSYPAIFDTLQRQNQVFNVCYGENVVVDLDTTINNIIWNTNAFSSSFNYEANSSRTFSALYYQESCPDTVYISTFQINVLPQPDFQLAFSDNQPCEGDEVEVSVNPIYNSYSWKKIEYIDNDDIQSIILPYDTPSATLTESGTYTVSLIDGFLCENELTFEIDFSPLPDINVATFGRTNFCLGDSLYFVATHNGERIEWYEENEDNPISTEDSLLVLDSGNFYAIVTSAAGCTFMSDVFSANARIDTNNFRFDLEFDGNWFEKDIVEKGQYVCDFLTIRNYRDFDAVLSDPIIFGNTEFSIPQFQLPITIPALSTAELEVCFLAIGEGIRMDTILVQDRCSDQVLPLKAIVKDKEYNGSVKCNLDLRLVDVSLTDDYFITYGVPYPNPATNQTKLEFIEFVPDFMTSNIRIELFDMMGIKIKDLSADELERETENFGDLIRWNIDVDVVNLQAGRYVIKITSPDGEKVLSFLKI